MHVPPGHFPPPPPGPSPYARELPLGPAGHPLAGSTTLPLEGFDDRKTPVVSAPTPPTVAQTDLRYPPSPFPPGAHAGPPSAPHAGPPLGLVGSPLPQHAGPPLAPLGLAGPPPVAAPMAVLPQPAVAAPGEALVPPALDALSGAPGAATARGRHPRRRWLAPVLVLLSLLLVTGLASAFGALFIRPWLVAPAQDPTKIERHFAKLRRLGEPPRAAKGGSRELIGAALLAEKRAPTPGEGIPHVKADKLDKSSTEAMAALGRWLKSQGDFTSLGCRGPAGSPISVASAGSAPPLGSSTAPAAASGQPGVPPALPAPLAYYHLGRLALESGAGGQRIPPRVQAALRLGHLMRTNGTLEEYAVGSALSLDAARWLKSRKASPDASFQTYRPRVGQLRAVLAREAVCGVAQLEGLSGWGFDASTRFPGSTDAPPFGLISYERERLVVEDFFGSVLDETQSVRDGAALIQALLEHERPRSVALGALIPPQDLLERLVREQAEYDALVPVKDVHKRRPPRRPGRRAPAPAGPAEDEPPDEEEAAPPPEDE